jgi:hypothetical protein
MFNCAVLFYWIMLADKIRRDEILAEVTLSEYLPKVVLIGIFGILSLGFFAWTKYVSANVI